MDLRIEVGAGSTAAGAIETVVVGGTVVVVVAVARAVVVAFVVEVVVVVVVFDELESLLPQAARANAAQSAMTPTLPRRTIE